VVRALESKEMKVIARKLWEVFCEYKLQKYFSQTMEQSLLISDKSFYYMYKIDYKLITAYHSSANGLVERKKKKYQKL
jgi:hypothetical protein